MKWVTSGLLVLAVVLFVGASDLGTKADMVAGAGAAIVAVYLCRHL